MNFRQPLFAALNGTITHYRLSGSPAGVPLVFVNSLGADLRIWDALIPYFEPEHLVVRYDKRGHGLSGCPPSPFSLQDFSRDLDALAKHLGLEKFFLTGISVGGQIALQYALQHPEKVRALVLSDTAARIGTEDFWNERIGKIRSLGMATMAAQILPRWFGDTFRQQHPEAYQGYLNLLSRVPPEGYIGTCTALAHADLRAASRDLKMRSLVIVGAEDEATTPETVKAFAGSLPGAAFEVISGAGHHPCIENPAEMAAVMKKFFQEVSNA